MPIQGPASLKVVGGHFLCGVGTFGYTEDGIKVALEAITNGAGVREATRHWGIPKTTLLRRFNGAQNHSDAAN